MLKEIESFLFLGLWNTAEIFRTPFMIHRKYFSYKWCPLGENHSILVREGKAPTVCTSVWCYFPWMRGFGLQGDQFDRLLRVQVLLYCPWKRTFSIAIGSYPGINTVTKVFTSDFILLCVKGSQNVAYKLFQRAVLVMCCYRGSWESHPNSFNSTDKVKSITWSSSLVRLSTPARDAREKARRPAKQDWDKYKPTYVQAQSIGCRSTTRASLISAHVCSAWQWHQLLLRMTKSGQRKFGQYYLWPGIQNGGTKKKQKTNCDC